MARDKDGQLIARNATSQRAFDMSVDKVKRNWNLDPLSAIPEANGLRPTDLDDVSMDFVRYLAYLSDCEKDVSIVQAIMIRERDRRLGSKDQYQEKDKRLKDGDVKAIYERHYKNRFHGDDSEEHQHETNQYHARAGKGHKSVLSTWDSGGCRTSDGSSSGSSTPLLRSIHVTQLGRFNDISSSRKRQEITDGHVSPRRSKRPKPLITTSAHVTELQQPSQFQDEALSSSLRKVSSGHHSRSSFVEDEAWEDGVITERVASEKSPAEEAVLLDAQPVGLPLQFGKRNSSYGRDLSRPTISPLSDGPTKQLASKLPTTTMSTPRDPLHDMLDKITTGFTDNLFFLHGILRTHAAVDTARARGEALDAAAADVLKSMNIFRKRVELISEGIVERPFLAPLQSIPATPDRPSEPLITAGDQKTPGAVPGSDVVVVHSRNTPQSEAGHDESPQGTYLREEQITRTMPPKIPLGRPAVKVSQGPDSGKPGAAAVPRATYRELWEELFINPWSTETK